jgi:eukaryotic-like serine/threonine-protein kinase
LKKVDISGGRVQTICDAPTVRGGTWNKDDVIVFTPDGSLGGGLYRVAAAGGTPTRLSTPDANRGEQSHRWPMFLPDGKHYLYMASNFSGTQGVNAIFVGSLDSDERRFVGEASANAAYAQPGTCYFAGTRLCSPSDSM